MRDRNADVGQFSTWAHDHAPALVRFGVALTGDATAGDALVQHALARTYAGWPAFGRSDPELFARRVMLHRLIADARRVRGRTAPEGKAEGIASALVTLAPRPRAIVVAQYCEGRGVREAGELLGWSEGTVKRQGDRALAALAPALGEGAGTAAVVAALRDAYQHIPSDALDVDASIARATDQGTARRRRELQTRIGVFVAVCVFALAGMVGLSRGGHRIPRFGGPGALIASPSILKQ